MSDAAFAQHKYQAAVAAWVGFAPLAGFAAVGAPAAPAPPTADEARQMVADMNQALDNLRGLMREKHGAVADDVFDAADDAGDDPAFAAPDPRDAARNKKRAVRAKRKAARLARGEFPVRVADPDGTGPRPEQDAAFRHLMENEATIRAAVLAEVWTAFGEAYDQEDWRQIADIRPAATPEALHGRFGVSRVEIAREHRGGLAHLVFTVESDWQDEHGLFVVYSPDTRAAARTDFDGLLDLLPSDDPADREADYVPTPHDELVEAVLNGNEARARDLLAAGADINALAPGAYPPLCVAVDRMEAEEVRRLLTYGADPNLPDPDERRTALKLAKRMYKELGFGPAKANDPSHAAMTTLAREASGEQYDEMKVRLDEITGLLKAAGGK